MGHLHFPMTWNTGAHLTLVFHLISADQAHARTEQMRRRYAELTRREGLDTPMLTEEANNLETALREIQSQKPVQTP